MSGWTPDPDADPARWGAELWLASRLFSAAREPRDDAITRAGIDAAQGAGVLSAEEAAAWRARVDGAPLVQTRPLDGLSEAAAEKLERALASGGDDGMRALFSQVSVLMALGVLSPDEAQAWTDRARARLGLPELADHQERRRASAAGLREVRRVAVGGPGHGALQVIELVCFAESAELEYVLSPTPPPRAPGLPRRFEVADDRGTRYRTTAPAWGWSAGAERGRLRLQPAPPDEARWVEVAASGEVAWVMLA